MVANGQILNRTFAKANIIHSDDHESGHHSTKEAFDDVYLMCFMALLWIIRLGLPDLVCEITIGTMVAPNLLDVVPYSDALIVIGGIGLVLLVFETGIDIDIDMSKLIRARELYVAVFGSVIVDADIYWFIYNHMLPSTSIGAFLAITSMGIAVNALRSCKVLNTSTGQLIITAAILDVIALMLLSELEAPGTDNLQWFYIAIPSIVSPVLIAFLGVLSIEIVQQLLNSMMNKIAPKFLAFGVFSFVLLFFFFFSF